MALNKTAAAYLAYFAYIDDALETVLAGDFVTLSQSIPAGAANGPWKLCWGPAVNDGILGYVAQGADGGYALAFRGADVDGSVSGSIQNVIADANGFFLVPWLYPQQAGAPLQISAGINGALARPDGDGTQPGGRARHRCDGMAQRSTPKSRAAEIFAVATDVRRPGDVERRVRGEFRQDLHILRGGKHERCRSDGLGEPRRCARDVCVTGP